MNSPYRQLDFVGFKKVNDVWVIRELKIKSESGKSILVFNENQVEPIPYNSAIPKDLFLKD